MGELGLPPPTSDSSSPRLLIPHFRYTVSINIQARTGFFALGKLLDRVRALGGLGSWWVAEGGAWKGLRFGPEPPRSWQQWALCSVQAMSLGRLGSLELMARGLEAVTYCSLCLPRPPQTG